jgi:hypothetical protein
MSIGHSESGGFTRGFRADGRRPGDLPRERLPGHDPAEQCAVKKHFEHPPVIRVDSTIAVPA